MADTNSHRFNDCGVICFGGVKPTDTHQMLFSPPIRGPTSPWQAGRLPQNTAIGEGPEWVIRYRSLGDENDREGASYIQEVFDRR